MTGHGHFGKSDQLGSLTSGAICCLPNKRDLLRSADRRLNLLNAFLLQPSPLLLEGSLTPEGAT